MIMQNSFASLEPVDPMIQSCPFLIEYEMTRQCDLVCGHCSAMGGPPDTLKEQMPSALVERLIGQVSNFPEPALLLLSGGDALYRHDVFRAVRYASELNVPTAMKLCPTPRLTPTALGSLQRAGLNYLIMNVDGADATSHDRMRGGSVSGEFARTLRSLGWARQLRLPVQAQTLLTFRTAHYLDDIAAVLAEAGVDDWQIYFLGPHSPGLREQRVAWTIYGKLFDQIAALSDKHDLPVEIIGANHHVPYAQQHGLKFDKPPRHRSIPRRPSGLHAGKGIMFVDYAGNIFPARDMPLSCGSIVSDWLIEVYQKHRVFRALRDPDRLRGKCGLCEYRAICGGNRARALAETGHMLGDDPDCDYLPGLPAQAASTAVEATS